MAGDEFWTNERCFITELVNSADHPAASLAHCRVTSQTLTEKHALDVDEWYVLISGNGLMYLDDTTPFPVAAGDQVHIPAGTAQQIRNTGTDDLLFNCLCMPRFTEGCYHSLETTE